VAPAPAQARRPHAPARRGNQHIQGRATASLTRVGVTTAVVTRVTEGAIRGAAPCSVGVARGGILVPGVAGTAVEPAVQVDSGGAEAVAMGTAAVLVGSGGAGVEGGEAACVAAGAGGSA